MSVPFRCILHGSFRKHFEEIRRVREIFEAAGIKVLAPKESEIVSYESGFALLAGEETEDPRLIELKYLHHLRTLGTQGFSYFVNPDGYVGRSAAYELGIAQATNVPVFCQHRPEDLPVYMHQNTVWRPERLAEYIGERGTLPDPQAHPDERLIHRLWEQLLVPGSIVAAGSVIEYAGSKRPGHDPEILLVKTHKWGGRYSLVGGRVRRHERLREALVREITEETGLSARPRWHICTFDQLKDSGYYQSGVNHIFVDYVAQVGRRKVQLNEEAQSYVWIRPREALQDLSVEPNARKTIEAYLASLATATG